MGDFGFSRLGLKSRLVPIVDYPFLLVLLVDDLPSHSMNKNQCSDSVRREDSHDVAT